MKLRHQPSGEDWQPFTVLITFESEDEATKFYKALQQEARLKQLREFGNYIEACSNDQTQQRERVI